VSHPTSGLAADFGGIGGARLGADPTRLRVVFSGDKPLHAPPPKYAAEVAESETAVAVTIRATTPRLGGIGVADAREIEVTLHAPFGARVLVDGRSGAPRPVIPKLGHHGITQGDDGPRRTRRTRREPK